MKEMLNSTESLFHHNRSTSSHVEGDVLGNFTEKDVEFVSGLVIQQQASAYTLHKVSHLFGAKVPGSSQESRIKWCRVASAKSFFSYISWKNISD